MFRSDRVELDLCTHCYSSLSRNKCLPTVPTQNKWLKVVISFSVSLFFVGTLHDVHNDWSNSAEWSDQRIEGLYDTTLNGPNNDSLPRI